MANADHQPEYQQHHPQWSATHGAKTNLQGEVPVIWYEFEGKNRRYYPDIFIPSQNKLIEVKSSFSYQYEEAKNQAKKKACETAGFLFELKIYASRPKPLN